MSEERLQILRMLESGKVSAEEALRLLEAVEAPAARPSGPAPKYLRIKVIDKVGRGKNADVKIPIGLVKVLGRVVHLGLQDTEMPWAEVEKAIQEGLTGRIAEVEDEQHRVEIYVE